jgi:hypothetical protein
VEPPSPRARGHLGLALAYWDLQTLDSRFRGNDGIRKPITVK